MTGPATLSRGQTLRRLILVIVLADIGLGMVIPLWALRGRQLGLSATGIGLLVSALGAGRLAASLSGGLASDRWGRRRVLVAGLCCLTVASLGASVTPRASTLFVLRAVEGVGWELMAVTGISAVVDLIRGDARQGMLTTRYQAARRGAQAMSPLLGGALALVVGIPRVFDVYAGLGLLSALLGWRLLPLLPARGERTGSALGGLRSLGGDPAFVSIGVLGFLLTGADLTFQQVLVPILGRDRGLSTLEIGAVLAAFGLVLALVSLNVGGRVIDRFGPRLAIGAGVVLGAVGYSLVPVLHGFTGLVVALGLAGVGRGLSSTAPTLLLLRLFPQRQGGVQGAWRSFNGVGRLITPVALGAAAGAVVLEPAVWGVAGALLAAAAGVVALTRRASGVPPTEPPLDED